MIANEKESVNCEDWIPFNKGIEVNNYIVIKRRKGENTKWDILEIESMKGDWNDLVFTLFENYGQFQDQVAHLSNRAARHDKLDSIAAEYASKNVPYEFVLADGTDDWYIAYVKPVIYRMDPDGSLR
jgi:hypothetical protein